MSEGPEVVAHDLTREPPVRVSERGAIGARLASARAAQGLTVEQIAYTLLLSKTQVQGLEEGHPRAFHNEQFYQQGLRKYAVLVRVHYDAPAPARPSKTVRDHRVAIALLVNPNGVLLNGGSAGDNGQTGRKLVVDYYGPRVAIGGGALSGKDLSHIDRAGAYAARHAALHAVQTGAGTCRIAVAYAPNRDVPLDVVYEMDRRGERVASTWFAHSAVRERYRGGPFVATLGTGTHFTDSALAWNRTVPGTPGRGLLRADE